jgi:hypothetical protein
LYGKPKIEAEVEVGSQEEIGIGSVEEFVRSDEEIEVQSEEEKDVGAEAFEAENRNFVLPATLQPKGNTVTLYFERECFKTQYFEPSICLKLFSCKIPYLFELLRLNLPR